MRNRLIGSLDDTDQGVVPRQEQHEQKHGQPGEHGCPGDKGTLHLLTPAGPEMLSHQYSDSGGEAHHHEGEDLHDLGAVGYPHDRGGIAVPAHDQQIHRAIDELKQRGPHKGKCEPD